MWNDVEAKVDLLNFSHVAAAAAQLIGRDADLVVMVDCQIPSDDLIVHFF